MTPLMLFVLLLSSEPAWAECGDTGDTGWRMDDCDADGVTPAEGDCDDHNDNAYPGLEEQCDDFDDNNCDGFFNENCDDQRQRGTLMGGSI